MIPPHCTRFSPRPNSASNGFGACLAFSSFARVARRLLPALRYAAGEQPPPGLDIHCRVASDMVRLEY